VKVWTHVWYWRARWNGAEKNRKGMRCSVLVRGGKGTVLVEMEDGERVYTSRYAVRRIDANGPTPQGPPPSP